MAGVGFWACDTCNTASLKVAEDSCPKCGRAWRRIAPEKAARAKYAAVPTVVDGIRYASKKEAARARELALLMQSGHVARVDPHPVFLLQVNGVHVCAYVGDFQVTYPDGRVEIEDVKGVRTTVYKLKKKLMRAVHGIEIVEVGTCRKAKPRRRAGAKPRA